MKNQSKILALNRVGEFLKTFLETDESAYSSEQESFSLILRRSTQENPWFTHDALVLNLAYWAEHLNTESLSQWLSQYQQIKEPKKIGLILAGNIPMVGFHDVLCCLLSGHSAKIKLSSKDQLIIPFLVKLWEDFGGDLSYEWLERLENFDAIIATGSNNTARYFEYYFKNYPRLIRKNRTSVGVLSGKETPTELQALAKDIFTYFGLGCRNVSHLFLPHDMPLDLLFTNFTDFSDCINHHKYANNYDYNKAIYLLNQDLFWDNNFVMLREQESLFSPLSVVHFTRYNHISEVETYLKTHQDQIQCVVSQPDFIKNSIALGSTQNPDLENYADQMDSLLFLRSF